MTRPPLHENRTLAIMQAARDGGYAVPAMCCYNLEAVMASVRAAEEMRSPLIIQLFPWAMQYARAALVRATAEACHSAAVPIAFHIDHAQDPDLIRGLADIPDGVDSIMCDMSHYEKEENLALTKELTEYCHARGIATEAEPGRIEGGEDGVAETLDLEGVLTTPEQAEEFIATGIEMLAPAFGNVHGEYGPRGIVLDYSRLEKVYKAVGHKVHFVLHGADPFSDETYARCIKLGVSKVNVNKPMNDEYIRIQAAMAGKPVTEVIEAATAKMQEVVATFTRRLGSAGKA